MNGPHFLFDAEHVLPAFPKQALEVQVVDGEPAARLFAQHFAQRELELVS
ncbi:MULTISPECIES: hypothetical protein [Variovorax]|nr:hypothetical protein [Variovorax sp. 3319]MDR6886102.1 hypothetical protein [Variovorax sp. 3319]